MSKAKPEQPADRLPPTRFVLDAKGGRIPVAEGEDIVAAARRAKGLPAAAPEPEKPEEN